MENAVFNAAEKLISEKGFSSITFTEIMKLVDVEPQVKSYSFCN